MINKNNQGISLYRQIVDGIIASIRNGDVQKGDVIPSLNTIKSNYNVSRDTVIVAYKELKVRGIIDSKPGKGYYIINTNIDITKKIFLLLDENSSYKNSLYKSFINNCRKADQVEVFYHHQNPSLFKALLETNIGKFSHYVLTPVPETDCINLIDEVSKKGKVYILDYGFKGEEKKYNSVYQDFEADIFSQLSAYKEEFQKFNKILMVIDKPVSSTECALVPKMIRGFEKFSENTGLSYTVVDLLPQNIQIGTCYILHADTDLVKLVENAHKESLELGKDIGLISFNESPLKRVVDKGVTTLSTNFVEMGNLMAKMVKGELKGHIKNDCQLIRRNSF